MSPCFLGCGMASHNTLKVGGGWCWIAPVTNIALGSLSSCGMASMVVSCGEVMGDES